jgi:type II secretory pathway pseudopilin PulG
MKPAASLTQRTAGFGLLEVLVVLFIVAGMASAMLPMLSQFRPLREKGDELARIDALQSAMRHVVRTLEAAEPMVVPSVTDKAENVYMDGKPSSVRFIAVTRRGALTAGLFDVRIAVDSSSGTPKLVQQIRNRQSSADGPVQQITLADNITAFSLRYFSGGNPIGSPTGWPGIWESGGVLPQAVLIEVSQSEDGRKISLSSIAALTRR